MDNNFNTELNMQDGTMALRDESESLRFPFMIDQAPDVIKAIHAAYDKAKFLMANPLLDTSGIDEFMKNYQATPSPRYRPMVEAYQGLLALLSTLESSLHETARSLAALNYESDFEPEISRDIASLNASCNKITAVLDAHRHHIPK